MTIYRSLRNLFGILRNAVVSFERKKTELVFVLLLFVMIFTRYSVTYLNREHKQRLPESVFAMDRVGMDWLDGVMQPVFSMLEGQPFNPAIGYGQSLTTVAGILVSSARWVGLCPEASAANCSNEVYRIVFAAVFFGFFLFTMLVPYGKDKISVVLFIAIFFLGSSGSLGLDRGNLDIVFSFVLFTLAIWRLRRHTQTVVQTITEAIVLSFLVGTKVTILPFAAAFLITSGQVLPFIIAFAGSYVGFSHLPLLFHRPAALMDPFIAAKAFGSKYTNMFGLWCPPGNHAVYSLAAYGFDCSRLAIGGNAHDYLTAVRVLGYMLFFLIVVWPLRILMRLIQGIHTVKQWGTVLARANQGVFLLMLSLGTASINLLPFLSHPYRLYYSFFAVLTVWYAARDAASRRTIMLSSVFLLLKGLWIADSRVLNVFVALHYYFLISAAAVILTQEIAAIKKRL